MPSKRPVCAFRRWGTAGAISAQSRTGRAANRAWEPLAAASALSGASPALYHMSNVESIVLLFQHAGPAHVRMTFLL